LVGELLTYKLTSANGATSTLAATGVTLTDSLATSTVFVSASAGCVYDAVSHTVTCEVGNLAAGAFASSTIVVMPTAAGVITNTAEVAGNELDLNPANNTAMATTTVVIVSGVCGDVNDDGVINVFDAIMLLQIIVGLIEPTETQLKLGDVVHDGTINVFDAILLLQHIVGLTEITDCGPPTS
ncbi:MAG: dockerin type I domain-containing protein, partial [Chloroflexi bacterium]|nr:dockerin type I domain-containing protein [Chloroflexota bacterium]